MIKDQSNPRVYISGTISSESTEKANSVYQNASELLTSMGCIPVIPQESAHANNTHWESSMPQNIEILCTCDAILMLNSWRESKGAIVEHCIATQKKMPILFEEEVNKNHKIICAVKAAVEEVTGLSLEEYAISSRKQHLFFARMLFAYHCHKLGMTLVDIAAQINKDHTAITYYLKRFPSELQYNNQFAAMVHQIDERLHHLSDA